MPTDSSTFILPVQQPINWIVVVLFFTLILLWTIFSIKQLKRDKLDLFNNKLIKTVFISRLHPNLLKYLLLFVFIFILYDTIFGYLSPGRNPSHNLVWTIWWPLLAIIPILLGRSFCGVCPVSSLSGIMRRISPFTYPLSKNITALGAIPAVFLLILFSILNNFFMMEEIPFATGQFLVLVFIVILLLHYFFKDRIFCIHFCPVGLIQSILSRISPFYVGTKNKGDLIKQKGQSVCKFALNPHASDLRHFCTFCGDCIGKNSKVSIWLRSPFDDVLSNKGFKGETLLLLVLLSHLIFEQFFVNDAGQILQLIYDRAFVIFMPTPAPPNWIPLYPLPYATTFFMIFFLCFTLILRGVLIKIFRCGSKYLSESECFKFSSALIPFIAFVFIAFHLPAFTLIPEFFGRILTVIIGGNWSDLPLLQATEYPARTILILRELFVISGFIIAIILLKKFKRETIITNKFVKGRFRAEILFLLFTSLFIGLLFLIPTTLGDVC